MAEKSMSKFSQYLAANNLKDLYFQQVFYFWHQIEYRKYLSWLEDTLNKQKTNWKATLICRIDEFIKKFKLWKFEKI